MHFVMSKLVLNIAFGCAPVRRANAFDRIVSLERSRRLLSNQMLNATLYTLNDLAWRHMRLAGCEELKVAGGGAAMVLDTNTIGLTRLGQCSDHVREIGRCVTREQRQCPCEFERGGRVRGCIEWLGCAHRFWVPIVCSTEASSVAARSLINRFLVQIVSSILQSRTRWRRPAVFIFSQHPPP